MSAPPDPDAVGGAVPDGPLHLRPLLLLVVATGGALGTLARYGLGLLLPASSGSWPTATLVANLVGSFALGALLEALGRAGPDTGRRRLVRLAAGTGVCGGLTTYSTFAVEADLLVRGGHGLPAAAYALLTVLAGLALTVAGVVVGARRAGPA